MSKRSKQKFEDAAAAQASAGAGDPQEEAVTELSAALDALPRGGGGGAAAEPVSAPFQVGSGVADEASTDDEEDGDLEEDDESLADDLADDLADEFVIHDADAEDRAEELARMREGLGGGTSNATADDEVAPGGQPRGLSELMAACEALIFVSEEPLQVKAMADVLGEERGWVEVAVESLEKEFNERHSGLMLREVAGGWQIATRPEHHEHIRAFLKSKPSAKLSLAALETLAVIAYKQPVTVPEILEIRGVQSSSAIKTLLDKRLIIAKGRKETIGRPMMYGTSKEFLLQFGLRDLTELPNVEDFEDLAGGGEG
jgi:segregation and condensation protein B